MKAMPSPIGIGFHSILVPFNDEPSRDLKDCLPCGCCWFREDLELEKYLEFRDSRAHAGRKTEGRSGVHVTARSDAQDWREQEVVAAMF